jgi:hypothetical protein
MAMRLKAGVLISIRKAKRISWSMMLSFHDGSAVALRLRGLPCPALY